MMTIHQATLSWFARSALLAIAGLLPAVAAGTLGQEAKSMPAVAAMVDGEPIFTAEVLTLLLKQHKIKSARSPASSIDFANALKQLIIRRLVIQLMDREGGYYSDEEIDKSLEKIKAEISAQGTPADEALAKEGISIETLRAELIWQTAWPRYIERNLTDQLQNFFNSHRKDFDGTLVQASHILLRPERPDESPQQVASLATKIREGIESGKLTFEQAAERFSVGPSRVNGGDLGFFPRHGVMYDAFSKTAFELEPGQVSEPITTPFGVHLIRVTNIKPGTKQWTEVLDELRNPASAEMLKTITERELQNAKVEFNPGVPYIDSATGKLMTPAAPAK